jgi:DNA-directed RNA polymerase specialized sigma24 family protein
MALSDDLLSWLDDDPDRAAQQYEILRQKLIVFFEQRRCRDAENLADETCERVLRKLRDRAEISVPPGAYFFGVARNVALEYWKHTGREEEAVHELTRQTQNVDDGCAEWKRKACVKECVEALAAEERGLLEAYYLEGRSDRPVLAAKLKKSPNAMRIEVFRIKRRLWACIQACLQGR